MKRILFVLLALVLAFTPLVAQAGTLIESTSASQSQLSVLTGAQSQTQTLGHSQAAAFTGSQSEARGQVNSQSQVIVPVPGTGQAQSSSASMSQIVNVPPGVFPVRFDTQSASNAAAQEQIHLGAGAQTQTVSGTGIPGGTLGPFQAQGQAQFPLGGLPNRQGQGYILTNSQVSATGPFPAIQGQESSQSQSLSQATLGPANIFWLSAASEGTLASQSQAHLGPGTQVQSQGGTNFQGQNPGAFQTEGYGQINAQTSATGLSPAAQSQSSGQSQSQSISTFGVTIIPPVPDLQVTSFVGSQTESTIATQGQSHSGIGSQTQSQTGGNSQAQGIVIATGVGVTTMSQSEGYSSINSQFSTAPASFQTQSSTQSQFQTQTSSGTVVLPQVR